MGRSAIADSSRRYSSCELSPVWPSDCDNCSHGAGSSSEALQGTSRSGSRERTSTRRVCPAAGADSLTPKAAAASADSSGSTVYSMPTSRCSPLRAHLEAQRGAVVAQAAVGLRPLRGKAQLQRGGQAAAIGRRHAQPAAGGALVVHAAAPGGAAAVVVQPQRLRWRAAAFHRLYPHPPRRDRDADDIFHRDGDRAAGVLPGAFHIGAGAQHDAVAVHALAQAQGMARDDLAAGTQAIEAGQVHAGNGGLAMFDAQEQRAGLVAHGAADHCGGRGGAVGRGAEADRAGLQGQPRGIIAQVLGQVGVAILAGAAATGGEQRGGQQRDRCGADTSKHGDDPWNPVCSPRALR